MTNRIITQFNNGSYLEYAQGRFDAWCIYHVAQNGRHAIKDIFQLLMDCTKHESAKKLYDDFIGIYKQTSSQFMPVVLDNIKRITQKYHRCNNRMEYVFSFLYAGMVAEENKEKAILKKRIKRLAIHQLLVEKLPPHITANFSRGKKWSRLDKECKNRGF